jgi:hypothetical protein
MRAKAKTKGQKEIHIGQFLVQGTESLVTANRAIMRLLNSKRCSLKEARYL